MGAFEAGRFCTFLGLHFQLTLRSGFFPAAVLMMNKWYLKFELSARVSIYYAGAAVSGAFSGLLAYALAKMDGIAGVAGWRYVTWMFSMCFLAHIELDGSSSSKGLPQSSLVLLSFSS